jgi:hypothetical protein
VRTTVTLEKDVQRLLTEKMHRDRISFKDALNSAVRLGLKPELKRARPPVNIKVYDMGLRPGIDPNGMNRLADELEVEAYLEKTARSKNS